MSSQPEITATSTTDTTESSGFPLNHNNNEIVASEEAAQIASASYATIALEDCKCPICLDYFIDVVETRCNHRFCNFCLENWLNVSIHRKCPTCRSTIQGTIQVKPELQELVNTSIGSVLTEEEVRERMRLRLERQAQVERFSADREQTQALLAQITTSSRPRARHIRRGRRFSDAEREPGSSFLSRHILNWWDDNNSITSEESRAATRSLLDGYPHRQRGPRGGISFEDYHADILDEYYANSFDTPDGTNDPQRASARSSQRGPRGGISFEEHYHGNLMEEYGYHLRRVNSAHTRVREAYRDFNYHNSRMQEILQEHRSFFSSMRSPTVRGANENNIVSYEDYEDLTGRELGELLDNSPAAQALFARFPNDNALGNSRMLHNSLENDGPGNFSQERGTENGNASTRNTRRTRRYVHFPNNYESMSAVHETNVLDMENEIRDRRRQMNQLSTLIRQCPFNPDARYTVRAESLNSRVMPDGSPHVSTAPFAPSEHVLHGTDELPSLPPNPDRVRFESTGRSGNVNNNVNAPMPFSSRRMRRRLARTNILRSNDADTMRRAETEQSSYNTTALPIETHRFLPAVIPLGDVGMSNANSRANDALPPTGQTTPSFTNRSNPGTCTILSNRNGHLDGSREWIANLDNIMNDSSESDDDDEQPTRTMSRRRVRRNSMSPHGRTRNMSVPPRQHSSVGFRRILRSSRRRLNALSNQENDRGTSVTAPASTSSTANSFPLEEQTDRLSTLANNATDNTHSDEGTFDRTVDTSDDSAPDNTTNHNSERSIPGSAGSTVNTQNNSISTAMRDITSMSDYLRRICDQFRTH